ncbi:Amino acid transporter [Entamoeba marina]
MEDEKEPPKVLGTVKLTAILFISIVGGAYGAEPMVQSVGPLLAIIILVLASLLVMLPVCLVTAELSTSLPSNSGLVEWVTCATHPYSNFFTMFITIVSLVGATIDNAVYPTLFISYLTEKIPDLSTWWVVLIKFVVTAITTILNITGVDIIGKVSVVFTLFTLFPFVVFCCFGLFSGANWSNLLEIQDFSKMNWSLLISVLFWNINGVDGCGNIIEDVKNVKRTVPRSMLLLVLMTMAAYILPCAIGSILDDDWANWEDGSFVSISGLISVEWVAKALPWLMFIGGLVSSLGYLLTLLCYASRLFYGFIQLDFHPLITKYIGHVNKRFGTPDVCIIIQGVLIFIFSATMDFDELVGVDSSFYAIRVLFITIAYVVLRLRYPHLGRPYKYGKNIVFVLLYATPIVVFCTCCCVLGILSSLTTIILSGVLLNGIMIASIVFYLFYPKQFERHTAVVNYIKQKHFEKLQKADSLLKDPVSEHSVALETDSLVPQGTKNNTANTPSIGSEKNDV